MSTAPVISVVMPVYNAERYVARAVASICEQTFSDFEFIIVNDGSTDGTLAILQDFAKRDARIKLISRPNTGVVGASNDALAPARGELIARMDGDDIAMPTRFEKQVRYMRAHPECAALGSWVRMIDTDDDPVRIYRVPLGHDDIDRALFETWAIFHPTMMTRRELIMRVGGYREPFAALEDLDLLLRLSEHGRLANLPEPLVQYRQHASSMCLSQSRRMNSIIGEILRQAYERRGLKPPASLASKRCGPDQHDPLTLQMMWAWWAHDDGFYSTARKHGLRLLRQRPLDVNVWRLFACAVRGSIRDQVASLRSRRARAASDAEQVAAPETTAS